MTVNATSRRADYTGDGTTTEFPVTFQFFEIDVYVDGELQTSGVDYNVSQEEPGEAGEIHFIAANSATPANGSAVAFIGKTRRVQEVDYVDNDDFPAEVHEAALDRLTMISQEQDDEIKLFLRAPPFHPEVEPLDFAAHPGTLVYINNAGVPVLASVISILGDVDIDGAIDAAVSAAADAAAADASADAAAISAAAAAVSAAAAASATGILSTNPVFTGLPVFEGGLRVGKNTGGNALTEFYDDTNNAWRSLKWDDTAHGFMAEDAAGTDRTIWTSGNFASQAEAVAGTENTKGMTALRVAQAIAALGGGGGGGGFSTGVICLFGNTSAPVGWTKLVDLHDYGIRIVSGVVGLSGSVGYATAFSSRTPTGTVSGTTLDIARIPSHTHTHSRYTAGVNSAYSGTGNILAGSATIATGATGGGGSHDHPFVGTPMSFSVNTADFIRAEKD